MLLMIAAAALQGSTTMLPADPTELRLWITTLSQTLDAGLGAFLLDDTQVPIEVTFLVLGAVAWTTAQFSAFSIFRYGRGGPAVMATGVILFLNVGLGAIEPRPDLLPVWPVLAIYSAMAMLLLMRLQLTQQGYQWARRHIADTGEVSRLFLRTGTLFVMLSVLGASSMTLVAMAPPQDVDVGDLADPLEEVSQELAKWLELIAVPREVADQTTVEGRLDVPDTWEPKSGLAFTARLEDPLRRNYWWGWEYHDFDGRSWAWPDELADTDYSPNAPLSPPSVASAGGALRLRATITTRKEPLAYGMVFRPAEAAIIGKDVTTFVIDEGGGIGKIELKDTLERGDSYTLRSQVRDYDGGPDALTEYELKDAGNEYPAWVRDRYMQGAGDIAITGQLARDMADRIESGHATAYERVIAVQQELRDLDYDTNMAVCGDDLTAECLLREGKGFCTYFASTMVVVLRDMGIPSRMITGYLPGKLNGDVWQVDRQGLHNWVEAYFPLYGWVRFDPTPGEQLERFGQESTRFEPGGPEPTTDPDGSPPPTPEPTPSDFFDDATAEPFDPDGECLDGCDDDDALAAFIIGGSIAGLLLLVTFGLLFYRFRRLPRAEGGLAFRGIVSLATRLGLGPHPSQTEYEYAGSLSEAIPNVRDDLYLVAEARVESAYGQREIREDRRAGLRRAYARIRTALLRLSLRSRR